YSPKKTYDALYLNNYATINVLDPLSRVRGVGQAQLFGALDYSLRLWLDTDRLTAFNLTPSDVVAAVQSQNVQAALGRIGAAPTAAIGIFQSPGANAVDVARHVREVMDELKQRFPDDLVYDVFWDSTVFVTSTIEEVVRTLVIAFVLVAIVVFLLLGKLRTTF